MDEQGVARVHAAERSRRDEGNGGHAVLTRAVAMRCAITEARRQVLVAEESADIVEARRVSHACVEQLAEVVGQDPLRMATLGGLDLADGLPGGHELDADPRQRGRP